MRAIDLDGPVRRLGERTAAGYSWPVIDRVDRRVWAIFRAINWLDFTGRYQIASDVCPGRWTFSNSIARIWPSDYALLIPRCRVRDPDGPPQRSSSESISLGSLSRAEAAGPSPGHLCYGVKGSMRERRPGIWQLRVYLGPGCGDGQEAPHTLVHSPARLGCRHRAGSNTGPIAPTIPPHRLRGRSWPLTWNQFVRGRRGHRNPATSLHRTRRCGGGWKRYDCFCQFGAKFRL